MGFKGTKAEKKVLYDKKLVELLEEYHQVLICEADNVGSKQLQGIRKGLRPDSVVLMGKNTMMKRSIRIHAEKTGNQDYDSLIPTLVVRSFFLSLFWFSFRSAGAFATRGCPARWFVFVGFHSVGGFRGISALLVCSLRMYV